MPLPVFQSLDVRAANETGDAMNVARLTDKSLQIRGTFSATLTVEGSLDETNFIAVTGISPITSAGLVQIVGTYKAIRITTSSYVSGTPLGILSGRDDRAR